jgi:hypothetical protein
MAGGDMKPGLNLMFSGLLMLSFSALSNAQAPAAINLHVKESAGIRRSAYPVNGRVPFPKGVLKDPAHVHLMMNDREIPSQIAAESKWPDQSIQWLDVDFNASIGPLEEQTYQVEYGEGINHTNPTRGLMVTETPDAIQVGNVRFNKKISPLVLSVHYRQEDIGSGMNGFSVTDSDGMSHDLSDADGVKVEVVKPGPLYAVIRYTGRAAIDPNYKVPFTITLEMTSGKTWVKYSAAVDDPGKRLRDISFNTPLALTEFPWLWDFGTGSWTYGSFRNPTDSVVLTQVVKPNGNEWQVKNGPRGQERLYEVAGGSRPKTAEGWGHYQDAKEVVAFGWENFGRQAGTYTVSFDAQGQSSFQFAAAQPATRHAITIYQHYVATPTPIGAVTSPVSMLNGLTATCDRAQYTKAGVPVP